MKYRVVFDPAARDDLADILTYLAPRMGVDPALAYVRRIENYCLDFSTFPHRGMRRDDVYSGLRLVGYRYKATIAFRVRDDVVQIARVFHNGRNIDFGPSPEAADPET
ncbi:type II toxin-antitoxin system RelE/ParE family toxin [Rhizobium sp. NFR12]|jgi:toxin ParE1/3/4|uniref:type II toxin-antitoxin system RelE/ParE family toxin n=1 Tax=Rhizobium sp. NFR12 TaxID=1566261 RepID=UPI0008A7F6D9|nr:type II toxin-antitoxin system RelE/ParE family toxin [Rhizobium sp. NFR12]SEH23924.1 Plasmid stabilization system protein ParE [Rhizobium sp. NFR12]